MEPTIAAIELTAANWEQWIGAALRAQRGRALLAERRAFRTRYGQARRSPRTRGSLIGMLVISAIGLWLLR
jgi:hypothetical protein